MATEHGQHPMNENHYRHLLIMGVLSFASMYVLMYAMVDAFENVFSNVNQLYMAGLMTAPMIVIDGGPYPVRSRRAQSQTTADRDLISFSRLGEYFTRTEHYSGVMTRTFPSMLLAMLFV